MSDQERVYGKDNTFKTQEEQEEYIRTWLRDTAGMEEASEQLQISWYTAWQERAENSLYSMGDITALISVRILILLLYRHCPLLMPLLCFRQMMSTFAFWKNLNISTGTVHQVNIGRKSSITLWVSFTQTTSPMRKNSLQH
jgi:hypothetical protein